MRHSMALLVVVVFIALACPAFASELTVDTGTYAGASPPDIVWWGAAVYLNDAGQYGVGVWMSGNLVVYNSWGDTVDLVTWSTLGGLWSGEYDDSLDWDDCFYTAFNAQTFDQYGQKYGNSTCNPQPPSYCDPNTDPNCGGGGGQTCDLVDYNLWDCCDPITGICDLIEDPIMINVGGGAWQLSGLDDAVEFDIRAVGKKDRIGWTAPGSDVAFLALDRNGNGVIDDGSELFGTGMRLGGGQRAPNGFAALAQFDGNRDGIIDRSDPVWSSLLLWFDRNHDGICQPDELLPVSKSSITAIELVHHWAGRHDSNGNAFRFGAHAHAGARVITFYDIDLVREH